VKICFSNTESLAYIYLNRNRFCRS